MFFAKRIVRLLRRVIFAVLCVLLLPIKAVFKLIVRTLKKVCKKIGFAIAKKKILRYNKRKKEQLKALSRMGFDALKALSMGDLNV